MPLNWFASASRLSALVGLSATLMIASACGGSGAPTPATVAGHSARAAPARAPAVAPSGCGPAPGIEVQLAFDDATNTLLATGSAAPCYDVLWSWSGSEWRAVTDLPTVSVGGTTYGVSGSPKLVEGGSKGALFFGTVTGAETYAERWHGGQWSTESSTGPKTDLTSAAYDGASGRVVFVDGGENTGIYANMRWSDEPTGQHPETPTSLANTPAGIIGFSGSLGLTSGGQGCGVGFGQTEQFPLKWTGSRWTPLETGCAQPHRGGQGGPLAYDPDLGGVAIVQASQSAPSEVDVYRNDGSWGQAPSVPAAVQGGAAMYDPATRQLLLVLFREGQPGSQTWVFANGSWSKAV